MKKGSKIYIEGRLQTRSWEDQNGVKKYRTEIIADSMIMLDSKGATNTESVATPATATASSAPEAVPATPQSSSASSDAKEEEISIEDIPF